MKNIFRQDEIYEDVVTLTSYNGVDYEIQRERNRRKEGFEEIKRVRDFFSTNSFISPEQKEEYQRQAQCRAKSMIKELCLCNSFTHFFTITCDGSKMDRFSIEDTQDNLKKTFKAIKRKYKDFKYICVTETHPTSGAFHFHGLCKGLSLENGGFFTNDHGYLQQKEVTEKMGLINSWLPIYLEDKFSYNKLVTYLQKYISKDCVKLDHYYFRSNDLERATRKVISTDRFYEIMGKDYHFNYNDKFDHNAFVAVSEYKINDTDQTTMLNIRELEENSKFTKMKYYRN